MGRGPARGDRRWAAAPFVALAALAAPPLAALAPDKALTQYVSDGWRGEEGLPQSSVFAVLQDREGYLWLGTQLGLARFDGLHFTVFDTRSTPSLGHDYVSSLLEDRGGGLWVGTVGGGLTRLSGGRARSVTTQDGLSSDHVRALCRGADGSLWIGTDAGLDRMLPGGEIVAFTTKEGLSSDRVTALAADASGAIWVGSDGGLDLLRDGVVLPRAAGELPDPRVLSLLSDRIGHLWIGTQGGLVERSADGVTKRHGAAGPGGPVVGALCEDRDGNLWIGTFGGGIGRLTDGRLSWLTSREGLANDLVASIAEDREGSLWIGTNGGGLVRLKDAKFTTLSTREGLSHELVLATYEDPTGVLWLGTAGGGLNRVEGGVITTITTARGLSSDIVFSVLRDAAGTVWVGTDGGLDRLEGDGAVRFEGPDAERTPRRVRALLEAPEGGFWVGTDGQGLMRVRGEEVTLLSRQSGLSNDIVTSLSTSSDGALWVGTEVGLNRLEQGKVTTLTKAEGLASDFVLTVYSGRDGALWIGTFGGLHLLVDGKPFAFTRAQGLTDGPVGGILEDGLGNLWLSTNVGICRVRATELRAVARGRAPSLSSAIWYGTADGMRAAECNGAYHPAVWKGRDGRLWFPTIAGAVVIDPDHIPVNRLPPPVILERVLVDRVGIDVVAGVEAVVPAGADEIEVSYTALSLTAPERIRFRYRLEGFDEDWVDPGQERTVHYTNLRPGRYELRVIACNEDGVWNERGASFSFRQEPHYWETPWFYGIAAALLAGAAWSVHEARVRSLKVRERELSAVVDEKTQHLTVANDELRLRNERLAAMDAEKDELLGIVAHDLKSPLQIVRGYAEILAGDATVPEGQRQDYLERVVVAAERMLALITNLLDVDALERGKMACTPAPCDLGALAAQVVAAYGDAARAKGQTLELAPAPALAWSDPGLTLQIADNLVSNAVKYSPRGKPIRIRTAAAARSVRLEVEDEGPGIPVPDLPRLFEKFARLGAKPTGGEHSTGLGLSIVRKMVETMQGRVWCESPAAGGARFVVELPACPPELAAGSDAAPRG